MREDMVVFSDSSEDEAGPSTSRQPAAGRVKHDTKRQKIPRTARKAADTSSEEGEDEGGPALAGDRPGTDAEPGNGTEDRRGSNAVAGPGPSSGRYADARCAVQ